MSSATWTARMGVPAHADSGVRTAAARAVKVARRWQISLADALLLCDNVERHQARAPPPHPNAQGGGAMATPSAKSRPITDTSTYI